MIITLNAYTLKVDTIENFDSIECVSYSSFLNAVTQTCRAEQILDIGWNELKHCNLIYGNEKARIVFYRDNLLYIVAQLIMKDNKGTVNITGQRTYENAANYYRALLLVNDKAVFSPPKSQAEQILLRDYFLRAYPYYYLPDVVERIYKIRFQRYWHIYNNLLADSDVEKNDIIKEGMDLIVKELSLSLKEYFRVITGVFSWFIQIPNAKRNNPSNELLNGLGFDSRYTETYYITKQNLGEENDLYRLIMKLSHNLEEYKMKMQIVRKDPIKGFYGNFQCFFDYPIFKIDEGRFCIIDLKFLFERICSGFIWNIKEISPKNFQSIKEQYGYLLERYFVELLKNIFGKKEVQILKKEGSPDAIIETDDSVLIFEFTVEYYRFASLYSGDTTLFLQDVCRILFNEGKNDLNSRDKKDKGKFHKLDKYLEKYINCEKSVIPILVTENYMGDFELLNRFNNNLENNIKSKNLHNLEQHKPLIINLDDLEIFWEISNSKIAIKQFIEFIKKWQELEDKGRYHFNFSYYISESRNLANIENDSNNFFNWKKFKESLK